MNNQEFKILSDASHLKLRPNMYIGSVSEEVQTIYVAGEEKKLQVVPGLLKIINEIIDNSVDAYIRNKQKGYQIEVTMSYDSLVEEMQVSVSDTGPGIPHEMHGGVSQPELCWFRARSGTSFSDQRSSIGANGVGSFCTAVFSTKFSGTSRWQGKEITIVGSEGEVTARYNGTARKSGCLVSFTPDLSCFNSGNVNFQDHVDSIYYRLENMAVCFQDIKFVFNGTQVRFKNNKELLALYGKDSTMFEAEDRVLLFKNSPEEHRLNIYLNGLHLKQGGTHIDFLLHNIIEEMRPMIKRKWKIEILPNQIKQNLFVGAWCSGFTNMKFDSQTKERLTNTWGECGAYFSCFDFKKIAKALIENESIITPIIENILHKKELEDARALRAAQKSAKKIKIANHIQANSRDVQERILLLTEGQSAIGMLIAVRDADKIGGYALRGKVMNTRGMKPAEIIKNKELSEIVSVLGLRFGEVPEDLNYGRIGIMTDADPDGDAIACMLVNFFSLWPDLFAKGRVCRVQTPLYICNKGKDTKWFYTKEDFEKANLKGWEVNYNKGLGSLSKEVYKEVINNPRLIEISLNDLDEKKLEMAFGDSSELRKKWLMGE